MVRNSKDYGLQKLASWLRDTRSTANFFVMPNKKLNELQLNEEDVKILVECEVTRYFSTYVQEFSQAQIETTGKGNDPPDCKIVLPENRIIGVEVVELINESVCACNAKCQNQDNTERQGLASTFRLWNVADIHQHCHRILLKKSQKVANKKRRNRGKWEFTELILLFYTDELDIDIQKLEAVRNLFNGSKFDEISRCYILLSYTPESSSTPIIQLY